MCWTMRLQFFFHPCSWLRLGTGISQNGMTSGTSGKVTQAEEWRSYFFPNFEPSIFHYQTEVKPSSSILQVWQQTAATSSCWNKFVHLKIGCCSATTWQVVLLGHLSAFPCCPAMGLRMDGFLESHGIQGLREPCLAGYQAPFFGGPKRRVVLSNWLPPRNIWRHDKSWIVLTCNTKTQYRYSIVWYKMIQLERFHAHRVGCHSPFCPRPCPLGTYKEDAGLPEVPSLFFKKKQGNGFKNMILWPPTNK